MSAGVQAGRLATKTSQRARSVWTVLALSTLAFVVLCAFASMAVVGYLNGVTVPSGAKVELRHGRELSVVRFRTRVQELVTVSTEVNEGDEVLTGPESEAFIGLFDGTSTIQTYFSTDLRIERLRTNRFFQHRKEATVSLNSGTAVFVTGDLNGYSAALYTVATDKAEIRIDSSSKVRFRIEGQGDEKTTVITVDYGSAIVLVRGDEVTLAEGQMARVTPDGQLVGPLAAQEELVKNGAITEGPTSGAEREENGGLNTAAWLPIREQPVDGDVSPDSVSVKVVTETVASSIVYAVEIKKEEGSDRFARAGIRQEINQPVDFLHEIELSITMKVLRQPEPVGGPQDNLYPLTVKVVYSDAERNLREWKTPFYFTSSRPDASDLRQVPEGSWATRRFLIKSSDLGRDIAVINAIEIYGYGGQYWSWVTDISMMAR